MFKVLVSVLVLTLWSPCFSDTTPFRQKFSGGGGYATKRMIIVNYHQISDADFTRLQKPLEALLERMNDRTSFMILAIRGDLVKYWPEKGKYEPATDAHIARMQKWMNALAKDKTFKVDEFKGEQQDSALVGIKAALELKPQMLDWVTHTAWSAPKKPLLTREMRSKIKDPDHLKSLEARMRQKQIDYLKNEYLRNNIGRSKMNIHHVLRPDETVSEHALKAMKSVSHESGGRYYTYPKSQQK